MSPQPYLASGLDGLLSPVLLALQRQRHAGVILLYHRVAAESDAAYPPLPPRTFEQHCKIIQRCFQTISLRDFVARLQGGKSLAGYCAITFDDGYRDFLDEAYPILRRYALPATHFLVTDSVQTGRPNWGLRMLRCLHYAGRHRKLELLSADKSAGELKQWLRGMATEERYDWLDSHEPLVPELPPEPPMLRAKDLSQCDPALIEWGSHTVSHPELARCDAPTMRHELEASLGLLRELTAAPVPYISYPIGSYSADVIQVARESGYAGGLAVGQAEVTGQSSVYAMPRFDVGTRPGNTLRLELGGAFNVARRLRGSISGT